MLDIYKLWDTYYTAKDAGDEEGAQKAWEELFSYYMGSGREQLGRNKSWQL